MTHHKKYNGAAKVAPVIQNIIDTIIKIGGALSALLIMCVFCVTIYSIFMRYVVSKPLIWADDFTGFLLVALIMMGAAEGYRRGNHIAIDLLVGNLKGNLSKARWIWSHFCVLIFSIVLGISTWKSVIFAHQFGSYSSGDIEIPSWIPQLPMLIAAALLALFALVRIFTKLFETDEQ